jgi:putative hydrolase of the HAD superfamily
LRAVERADLSVSGYGVKAFTISMVRAAISASNRTVPVEVIEQLVEIGQHMLTEPVRVLDHVPEVLATVGAEKRIVMITKGDLVHQTRKVSTSGLEHHFSDIEILLEKDSVTYAKTFRRLRVEPERVLMVGNSVKSDILPVLALGGHAVHIPYHMTWELERVDEHDEEFAELASMGELPGWLGL